MTTSNQAYLADTSIPTPIDIDLHLNSSPEFSRYAKKVRALGGRYSECRGYSPKRYVTLPWTDDGRKLANLLISKFGQPFTTVVAGVPESFRGAYVPAGVRVHTVPKDAADPCGTLESLYRKAFAGRFPEVTKEHVPTGRENQIAWYVQPTGDIDLKPQRVEVGRKRGRDGVYNCRFEDGNCSLLPDDCLYKTEAEAWATIVVKLARISNLFRLAAEEAAAARDLAAASVGG